MYKIDGIGIHIKVRDFKKSAAFYKALGFKQIFEYGPDKDVKEDYSGMVFDTGSGKLEIADGHRAVKPEVFRQIVNNSKVSLMVSVPSLTGVLNKAQNAEIKLAVGPRHFYWATLEAVIKDPDGVVLVFVAPYSEEEATKLQADESFAVKS